MLTFGKTILRTGGVYADVYGFTVSKGINLLLRKQNLATIGASFTFGFSLGNAGSIDSRQNNSCMSLGRNAVALLFTAIAVANLYAVFGAGGVLGDRPFTEAMGVFRSRNLILS